MTKTNTDFKAYAEAALREFIRSFEASLDVRLWNKLVEEETAELLDAIREGDKLNALKELADVIYVMMGAALVEPEDLSGLLSRMENDRMDKAIAEAVDAVDEAYRVFGFKGDVVAEAFARVHKSNMSKLDDDGKPIRREDGKIMKGPNYQPPVLDDLVS